jgi:hypothetical protein
MIQTGLVLLAALFADATPSVAPAGTASVPASTATEFSVDLGVAPGKATSPETVNVKDFGAVGDGVTDDTKAFNSAYQYLSDVGGKIWVPKSLGCYMVTEIIRTSRVSLSGDGPASSCIESLPVHGVSRPLLSTAHAADPVTAETIENLTLDGNRNAQSGISGDGRSVCIYLGGYRDTTLRNLVVKDCYTDGIYVTGSGPLLSVNGSGLLLDHVQVSNSRRNNVSIISGDNITIKASSFNDANGTAPQSGIDIEPNRVGQTTSNVFIGAGVVFSGNKGAGLSVFSSFQSQPSMNLVIDGAFIGNGGGVNIISGRPYEIGQIHVNGRFQGNGIGLAGVHDVVVGNVRVDLDGTALYADRVSHMEIGAGALLSGTTYDLYLTHDTTSIHLGSRRVLAHQSVGGFRGGLSGN